MNTAIRVSAISNADHSSRAHEDEFYLMKDDFEEEVLARLSESGVEKSGSTFDYLENQNGSIKAVRLLLETEGREYQTTAVVDIVE